MRKKLKKYSNGGDFLKNMIYGSADTTLSTIGLSNVIGDDKYSGTGANFYKGYANVMGTVGKTALPMAGQMLGIPAPVTSAAINGIGQFNPQASKPTNMEENPNFKANMINSGMQFPHGGMVGANAELEKQENTLNPDGSTNQFNGPSHEQGGIPTQLDPGTLVFSDKLKDKETKKTFAELNKKNNTSKEDKVIDSEIGIPAKSAELMKKVKNMKSLQLYNKQEEMKMNKLQNYAKKLGIDTGNFAYGGMKKYDGGGVVDDSDYQAIKPTIDFQKTMNNTIYQAGQDQLNNNFNYDPYLKTAGQIGYGLLNNAGNLYDLNRAKNIENRSFERINPNLLDPTEDLKYNDRVYNTQAKAIRSASGGDAGTYLQNMRGNSLSRTMANSRIKMGYANQNAGIKNSIAQYNANSSDRETMANAQIRANQRNLQSQAISKIGQNTAMQMRDNTANSQQDAYLKMLIQMYPQFANMANNF